MASPVEHAKRFLKCWRAAPKKAALHVGRLGGEAVAVGWRSSKTSCQLQLWHLKHGGSDRALCGLQAMPPASAVRVIAVNTLPPHLRAAERDADGTVSCGRRQVRVCSPMDARPHAHGEPRGARAVPSLKGMSGCGVMQFPTPCR